MKIAYLLPRIDNKSSITIFRDLVKIYERNHDLIIDVFYFDKEVSLDFGIKVNRVSFWNNDILNKDYDIIHSSGFRPNLWVWINKFRFRSRTKFITTIHSYIYDDFKNSFGKVLATIFSYLWYKFLSAQDMTAVLTYNAKCFYSNKLDCKIQVVNNGKGLPTYSELSQIDKEQIEIIRDKYKLIIGTHAVLSKIKSLDTVIKALVNLPDACFIIIGDGVEMNNLQNLAFDLGVSNRVYFLGFKENIYNYFKYYDIYTMPSLSEGMPIALIEAVSSNTLCITSDIPTFCELFTENEILFFQCQNVNDFVSKIKGVNDEKKEEMIRSAFIRYKQYYTDIAMANNYLQLYNTLLQLR